MKKSTKKAEVIAPSPTKVALAVACVAATTLVMLALVAVSMGS